MNDENRQSIEDALRRYAEQRRRALGGPLAMPAHVRERLQREIARQSAAETAKGEARGFALWHWLARPWAWGGAVALVVGLIVWQQSDSNRVKYAVAARAPATTPATPSSNPPPPTGALLREVAGNRQAALNGAPVTALATGETESSRSTPGAPSRATPVSPTSLAGLARSAAVPEAETRAYQYRAAKTVSAPTNRVTVRTGGAPSSTRGSSASAPGRAQVTHRLAVPAPDTRLGAAFRAEANAPVLQQRYVQAPTTPVTPVLNSFRIEQAGRQIQLVDADGSVYPATLSEVPAPEPQTTAKAITVAAAPALPESVARAQPQTISPKGDTPSQSLQSLALNAMGTNVRLQQPVVFNGNLLITNLLGEPAITNQQALMTNEAGLQFLLSNSRLEGQVIVGTSNQFPIQAVPIPH